MNLIFKWSSKFILAGVQSFSFGIFLQKSFIPGKNLPGIKNLAGLARNFSGQL
ncbi:hypothetical protein BGP_6430 [Beggiatoa sp. PS]|nr:hypothetical protein BGP_6430 [Beggiatoa sp. PS]